MTLERHQASDVRRLSDAVLVICGWQAQGSVVRVSSALLERSVPWKQGNVPRKKPLLETQSLKILTQASRALRTEAIGTDLPMLLRVRVVSTALTRLEIPDSKREDVTLGGDG